MNDQEVRRGYKFVTEDLKSKHGECMWVIGEWKKHEGKLEMCRSGLHDCPTALDSLAYVYGDKWFITETRGEYKKDIHKRVSKELRLIQQIPAKIVAVKFAISCAERCLKYFEDQYPNDKRPREAIETAKNWLELQAESAARSAAESAWSAAESAWSAAESAAWSAAWSAAESAAESAARSAWSAARSAEIQWQRDELERIIKEVVENYKT